MITFELAKMRSMILRTKMTTNIFIGHHMHTACMSHVTISTNVCTLCSELWPDRRTVQCSVVVVTDLISDEL